MRHPFSAPDVNRSYTHGCNSGSPPETPVPKEFVHAVSYGFRNVLLAARSFRRVRVHFCHTTGGHRTDPEVQQQPLHAVAERAASAARNPSVQEAKTALVKTRNNNSIWIRPIISFTQELRKEVLSNMTTAPFACHMFP